MDKNLDSLPSKELLYSELLNTSVTEHVQELLQKKKKSSTFPVQKSSVLGRASKLLQSLKENENNVQNIEIIEEGGPVIDMSVTLVNRDEEYEHQSDSDTRNEDFENKAKERKIICYDSDSDVSKNESREEIYGERNIPLSSDSESVESENESEDYVIRDTLSFSHIDIKDYEKCIKTVINDLNGTTSSDSDDNTQESKTNILEDTKLFTSNSNRDQFGDKNSKTVLESQNNNKLVDSDDELSNQECQGNQEEILEHPKINLELKSSVFPDSKYHNHNCLNNNLDVSGERKRKLISVIEEGEELPSCIPIKQKRV